MQNYYLIFSQTWAWLYESLAAQRLFSTSVLPMNQTAVSWEYERLMMAEWLTQPNDKPYSILDDPFFDSLFD